MSPRYWTIVLEKFHLFDSLICRKTMETKQIRRHLIQRENLHSNCAASGQNLKIRRGIFSHSFETILEYKTKSKTTRQKCSTRFYATPSVLRVEQNRFERKTGLIVLSLLTFAWQVIQTHSCKVLLQKHPHRKRERDLFRTLSLFVLFSKSRSFSFQTQIGKEREREFEASKNERGKDEIVLWRRLDASLAVRAKFLLPAPPTRWGFVRTARLTVKNSQLSREQWKCEHMRACVREWVSAYPTIYLEEKCQSSSPRHLASMLSTKFTLTLT
jgi:hypothetical protein